MARVNVDILGINELKWTGSGEFTSDDHYIYYCGQKSLRRNGVAIMVNKRVWNAVFGYNLKNDRMISVCFQGKPFNIMVIQVYAPISNAEEAEVEWFCWLEKEVQLESCELTFIWDKMRTAAWEAASQIALRHCSKAAVGENQYMRFWWSGSSIPWSTHFTKGFLLVMRIWCHHEGF